MIYENDNPFAAFDLAEHLRDCITPYLEMTTSGLPNRVCITSGQVAWDDCKCGQLTVSLLRQFQSVNFPTPWDGSDNGGVLKCGPPLYVFEYEVTMLRCASETEGESPPTCAMIGGDFRVTTEDAWAVRTGLQCCICAGLERDAEGVKLFERAVIGEQVSVGPEGLCVGSSVVVTIAVRNGNYPCRVS